ncbi:MAG: 5-carboxymethyl-2-hydroxymuconate Delta-isomerase [Actinomycetota bacterium]
MPHVIIEYSANVADHHDIDALVEVVHDAAVASGIAARPSLRTRAVARTHYRVADGDPASAMIAMVARIGPGRDIATKRALATEILDAAEAHTAGESSTLVIAWSSEVQEIDADSRVNRNHVADAMAARTAADRGAS